MTTTVVFVALAIALLTPLLRSRSHIAAWAMNAVLTSLLFLPLVRHLVSEAAGRTLTVSLVMGLCIAGLWLAWCGRRLHRPTLPLAALGVLIALCFRNDEWSPQLSELMLIVCPISLLGSVTRVRASEILRCAMVFGILLLGDLALFAVSVDGRTTLPGENPIWIGRMCAIGVLAIILLRPAGAHRIFYLSVIPLTGYLFGSGSRGPALSLLTAVMAYAAARQKGPKRVLFVILAASAAVASQNLPDNWIANSRNVGGAASVTDRIQAWHDAARMWSQNPLAGLGRMPSDYGGLPYPHNSLLEIAALGGLIGLATFLGTLFIAARRAEGPLVALLVLAFMFTLSSGSIWSSYELWLLVTLVAGPLSSPPRSATGRETVSPMHSPTSRRSTTSGKSLRT